MIVLLLAIVLLVVVLGWLVVLVVSERGHLRERTELLDRAQKAGTRADELLEAFNRQLEEVLQSVQEPEARREDEQPTTRFYSAPPELGDWFALAGPFPPTCFEFTALPKSRLYGSGLTRRELRDLRAVFLQLHPDIQSAELDTCLGGPGRAKSRPERHRDLEAAARGIPWARGLRGNGGVKLAP